MKLNDPFGRVSKKNQRNYHSLRDRLLQEEIRDPAAIARFTTNMTATAVRLATVIVGASIVLVLIFPTFLGTLLALGALVLLWIGVGYLQTRLHLKRYAREECNEGRQGPRTS